MKSIVALLLGFVLLSPIAAKAEKTTKTNTNPPAASDIKYPYTFICEHCHMKITVKNADELKKECQGCPCGMTNEKCMPKKK